MLVKREPRPWTVVGIDNGSRLVAIESAGGAMTQAGIHVAKLTEHGVGRRCFQAMEWAYGVVEAAKTHDQPVHVFIEGPFIGPRTMSAAIPLSRLQGALMAGCYAAGAECVYEVAPSQWKIRVLGKGSGNADKSTITEWMRVHWPWLYETALVTVKPSMFQDVIDAGGVMLYGADILSRAAHLTEEVDRI